jgi:hypothetical protein
MIKALKLIKTLPKDAQERAKIMIAHQGYSFTIVHRAIKKANKYGPNKAYKLALKHNEPITCDAIEILYGVNELPF